MPERPFKRFSFVCFILFLALAGLIGLFPNADASTFSWLNYRPSLLVNLFLLITNLGAVKIAALIGLVIAFFLLLQRLYLIIPFLALTLLSSSLANFFKVMIGRPRPTFEILNFPPLMSGTDSFPSGHTTLAASFYGFLLIIVYLKIHPGLARKVLSAFLGITIFLVAFSRFYLGVHFPTDVLGGIFLGFSWASLLTSALLAMESKE